LPKTKEHLEFCKEKDLILLNRGHPSFEMFVEALVSGALHWEITRGPRTIDCSPLTFIWLPKYLFLWCSFTGSSEDLFCVKPLTIEQIRLVNGFFTYILQQATTHYGRQRKGRTDAAYCGALHPEGDGTDRRGAQGGWQPV
jgi:hypothetical protein